MKDLYIVKDRLNEALKYRSLTASQLAEKSGVNKSSVSRYLSGERIPRSDAIYKMATALNVDPSWILGYNVPMTPDFVIQLDDQKLIVEVEKLSPENKERLKDFLSYLITKQEEKKNDSEV